MEMSTGQDENSLDGEKGESQQLNEINFTKPIPASRLREHIQMLLDTKDPNYTDINGFDIEFNYIETQTAQEQYFGDYKTAISQMNKNKNRYSNVLPPEKTRVKLRVNEGDDSSDFINANYISGLVPQSEHAYVATQGPLQSTFGDFWRMVWELGAVVITMLTNEVENGKLKCDHYWPEHDCPMTMYPFKVSLETQEGTSELTTRKFNLQNLESGESREVHHFQYTAWPDHGLPVSTTAFLDLAHKVDTVNENNDPIVVHCSAGIGRSGTFCTVHSIVERLRLDLTDHPDQEPEFNIAKTVLNMRDQRPGMVQTKEQYMFCYLTLLEECERLFTSKQKAKEIANETLSEAKEEASDEKEPAENPEESTSKSHINKKSKEEDLLHSNEDEKKEGRNKEEVDKKDEEMKEDAFSSVPPSEFVSVTKSSSQESKAWPFGTPTLTHHNTSATESTASAASSESSTETKARSSSKSEEVKTADLISFD